MPSLPNSYRSAPAASLPRFAKQARSLVQFPPKAQVPLKATYSPPLDLLRHLVPDLQGEFQLTRGDGAVELEPCLAAKPHAPTEIFDLDGLVKRLGDREFVEVFVEKFMVSTGELMATLKEALEGDDVAAVHLQSHSIKGASASIGAESMRLIAAQMEAAAKGGTLSELPALYAQLEHAFSLFREVAPDLARQ